MKNVIKLMFCLAVIGLSTIKSEEQNKLNKVENVDQNKLENFKQSLNEFGKKTNQWLSDFTKHEDFIRIRSVNDLKSWFKKLPMVTKVIVVGETVIVVLVVTAGGSLYIALETGLIKIPRCNAEEFDN